jgi:hypothetical protein
MKKSSAKIEEKRSYTKRAPFPLVENMTQAATVTGAELVYIKMAKQKGCPAFGVANRIDLQILFPFLVSMLVDLLKKGSKIPGGFATWKQVLESEQATMATIERKSKENKLMETAEAKRQAAEACQFVFNELERAERELPPALAGLSSVECFKRLHSFTEGLRKNAQAKFEEVGK